MPNAAAQMQFRCLLNAFAAEDPSAEDIGSVLCALGRMYKLVVPQFSQGDRNAHIKVAGYII